MKLSPAQQRVIDALTSNQRLLCVEHSSSGLFAGKLYNAPLTLQVGRVQTRTLKALVKAGALVEKRREIWHQEPGAWTMYKLEYGRR